MAHPLSVLKPNSSLRRLFLASSPRVMKLFSLLSAASCALAASCPCQPASKRGILYTDARSGNSFEEQCPECSWSSNWQSTPNGMVGQRPSFQYIPMLRDLNVTHTGSWQADAQAAIAAGSQVLFSFNEPDIHNTSAGSNLPVSTAVDQHAIYMHPFVGKALIGSPAVSSQADAGYGLHWLAGFISQCSQNPACHFDFCSVHWYGLTGQDEMLFQHLESAHALCGEKPIWLTEVGLRKEHDEDPDPTDLDKCKFISSIMARLEGLTYLATYAFFMGRNPGEPVLPDTGKSFGKAYASGNPNLCA